jgi:hypothetical protein
VSEENVAVDEAVLQVAQADVPLDTWLTEVLNLLASVDRTDTRRSIEESVNRLAAAGLLAASSGRRPELTDEGRRIATRLGRFQSTVRARSWLAQEVDRRGSDGAITRWRLATATWRRCAEVSRQHHREKLLARQEILDGLLNGIAQLDTINTVVRRSRDRTEARDAIVALGYKEHQAEHILDTPVGRQTKQALEDLRAEKSRIESLIGQLDRE